MDIYQSLEQLVQYGIKKKLIEPWDVDYIRNHLISTLGLDEWKHVEVGAVEDESPADILETILDWAANHGKLPHNTVTYRDLLDTELMGGFVARPSTVIKKFYDIYQTKGPEEATDYFYNLAKDSHYIRKDRVAKNEHWFTKTPYGDLELTINLSKPEKDPVAIAAQKNNKDVSYPACPLCKENVGYEGRVNHPARQNHRIIPVELSGNQWFLQYSPYVYYNEHAIILSAKHEPMKISKAGFDRLLSFVEQFPHYFVGSNADLPIVGGSILSHDHFQGGHHVFPMAKAEYEETIELKGFEDITVGIIRWPMSVIRLRGKDKEEISELAAYITDQWKQYSDEQVDILAFSGSTPHNTVTPIVRRNGEEYEFDIVLRNNRTNEEHPLGIFHPHEEVHHIKKENIGLIEVMGLAVLPGRLKEELQLVGKYLLQVDSEELLMADEKTNKHASWALGIKEKHPELNKDNVQSIILEEVGQVFSLVLEHAGVFKRTEEGQEAFRKFLQSVASSLQ